MPKTVSVTSNAVGLSARSVFLPYAENLVFVRAPDWSSSKVAQIHTAPFDIASAYAAEYEDLPGTDILQTSVNKSFLVHGPCFARIHLANPGTGASLVFHDVYASTDADVGNWLMELLVWNDFGVWNDNATWSES